MGHVRSIFLAVIPQLIFDLSLVYPDDIKPRLLNYIYATLVLSDAEVNCKPVCIPQKINRL